MALQVTQLSIGTFSLLFPLFNGFLEVSLKEIIVRRVLFMTGFKVEDFCYGDGDIMSTGFLA